MEIQQVVAEIQQEGLIAEAGSPVAQASATLFRHFQACFRQWQQALSEMNEQRGELSTFSTKRFDVSTAEAQDNENLNDPEASAAAAPVWAGQLAADAATETLHLAMVRAGVPLHTPASSPFATMDGAFDFENRHSLPDEIPDSDLAVTSVVNPLRDMNQTSADHEHRGSSSPWSSNGFVPIAKAAFQRLPLILRRRVPSLDTLNQSYAKLFQTIAERERAVLSDAEAMNLLGEGCRDQLEVLRGLAVLRRTRDGWMLAAATSGTRVPTRSHAGGSHSREASHVNREARPKSSPMPLGVSESVRSSSTRKHFPAPTPDPSMGSSGSRVIRTGTTPPKQGSQQPDAYQPARRTDRVSSVRRISRDPLDNVTIM
ncbi:hypothetical protein F1559_003293 [Cyanidiococcus yangmingshanensis]|uniref:Uncharacterized protein n=1 Tax=Cyanidiococcus yangmingshanensis TaxID=2690220 RepID=A0A7J7ICW3_9RHOD|nr:hypothetical protein F1559_003293 [Cyanidiococcus yangmingshanensis]